MGPNATFDSDNITESTTQDEIDFMHLTIVYKVVVPIMMIMCIAAIGVNARCLAAVRWIRGSVSPTLMLSLSLAAADLFTSVLTLLSFTFHSYLPAWNIRLRSMCFFKGMEAIRLGGIITIIAHLTALAANHHLGIVRPLRYPGIATGRNIRILLLIIWTTPGTVLFLCSFIPHGFSYECSQNQQFLGQFSFRLTYSMILCVSLALMCCIYIHILGVVHVQTSTWARGGVTGGSYKHHGGSKKKTRSRKYHDTSGCVTGARQRLMVSVRAVYTTLYILGSFVIMYLPAVVSFLLVCSEGCRYPHYPINKLWINVILQSLLIVKPLTNPIIYAARMHEIKEATRRMDAALRWKWCKGVGIGANGTSVGGPTTAAPDLSGTGAPNKSIVCRLGSNGSSQPLATTTFIVNNDTTAV